MRAPPDCSHVILKGAAPLFVLIFGLCLRLERPSRRTPAAMLLLSGGMVLVAADRLKLPDRPLGIFLGLLSSTFSGLRWALTQFLITGETAGALSRHSNPLSTMRHTLPAIAVGAWVCVLLFERKVFRRLLDDFGGESGGGLHGHARQAVAPLNATSALLATVESIGAALNGSESTSNSSLGLEPWTYGSGGHMALVLLCVYFVTNATLVFVLVLAEFALVQATSSLTLSVFGVLKELCTVFIGVMVGDHLSALNLLGLFICLCGTGIYHAKRTKDLPEVPENGDGNDLIEQERR